MLTDAIAREGHDDGDAGGAVCDADDEVGGAEQSNEGCVRGEGKVRRVGGFFGRERERERERNASEN